MRKFVWVVVVFANLCLAVMVGKIYYELEKPTPTISSSVPSNSCLNSMPNSVS